MKNEFQNPMEHLEEISSEELIKRLANAYVTYLQCGGHNKAEMNKGRTGTYIKELQKRNVDIPNDDQLSEMGKFNGEGAY